MAESPPSAVPALRGLVVEAVEWLPSGAESGLVRVRGRWIEPGAQESGLPALVLRATGREHRFESLPDARFRRDPDSWRGTYLVAAELVSTDPEALWLEWESGARSGLPPLSRGLEPPPVAVPEPAEEEADAGGEVIDRAVLAERRARRAEAAEQSQSRRAAEALKAVEVLELRSAELERRLEEATAERDALAARPPEPTGREALASALAAAAALRSQAREWQLRMRTSEVARSSDAVRLAVLEAEHATGTTATREALKERTAELVAARREAEARTTELAAATEAATAARAEAESLVAGATAAAARDREQAESRLAEATAAVTSAREQAESRLAEARAAWDLRREQLEAALQGVRSELDTARREAEAQVARARDDAAAAATELIRARDEADGRIAELHRRAEDDRAIHRETRAELERALADDRSTELEAALAATQARLQTAETRLATAEAQLRVETVARTTLEDELDRARAALAGIEQQRESSETALRAARAEIEELRAEAERAGASFQERIAELESRAADTDRLERLAREQAQAAAARGPSPAPTGMAADLDAAAAALRNRTPTTPPEVPEPVEDPPPPPASVEEDSPPPASVEAPPPPVEVSPPPASVEAPPPVELSSPPASVEEESPPPVEASSPPVAEPPSAPPKPAGPRIVSPSRPPSRAHVVGSSRRDYPLLRGAVVKLAHDDPEAAGRLLLALLPAQAVVLTGPLAYDLTVGELGTFGVTLAGKRTFVERLERPRSRSEAEFHLRGDSLVLAELLAGVDHRIRRFFGPVRARGRRRQLKALRALPESTASLAELARAGAKLDPELVYRALAYAVHPSWTRGHRFTVAQAITGEPPETWYLTAHDGAGLAVSAAPPDAAPDATVSMTRAAFDRMLRGEPAPAGERPLVRGDREAVALMRAWTLRAQGASG